LGQGVKMSSKVPYLKSPTLICQFTMQLLWGYSSSPSCIPNLKLLPSTVAEINRGSQIFTRSSSPDPLILALKVVFGKLLVSPSCILLCLVSYYPSPSCMPNLDLLASMAAEISRGSQIYLDAPYPAPLPILVLKVVSW